VANLKDATMENLIAALIDSLEAENDPTPEGYDLEATQYTITVTVMADLARANMLETA
jgi:hypothetical protein